MDRRDFLKSAAVAVLAAGLADRLGAAVRRSVADFGAAGEKAAGKMPDLVAVKGEKPADMFDRGIAEFGGLGAFVKPGDKVVIKPNIGWNQPPEMAANTNPELVGHLVRRCLEAGAASVTVFDHTCENWVQCYAASGIRDAVEAAHGRMVTGEQESDYRKVSLPDAVRMKEAQVHRQILEADVFFNVPVLKHHGGAKLSCAMKNFMGLVWDRRAMHRNNLQQCIADASLIRRPDLNIVDAFRVMMNNGPRGNAASEIKPMKSLLLSRDIVAVDTAACRMIGFAPDSIGHLKAGQKLKLGTMDLSKLDIRRLG